MITDSTKFIGTLFTVVGNKNIHCNVCDQLCQFSIDQQKSIEYHMQTLPHVLKLQTLYVQQTTKTLGKGLLFSLQIANKKNKEKALDTYFEECIQQMDYINTLEYEQQKEHVKILVSFYNFLYKHQIELLDPQDIITYLNNKQSDVTVFKQLLLYHKMQFTASQALSLAMINRENARRAVDKLSAKQCEIYFNQMIDEFKTVKPLFALPYMLIRLPYMDCEKVFEVEVAQLANDTMLQISQDISIPIPVEVQKITQHLIEKGELNIKDQLKVTSSRLTRARTQLTNQTQDYLYKLFLQNATLKFVKNNMKEDVIDVSQEKTKCKKIKLLQKEQNIQLDDSDSFSVQIQL